MTHKTIPYRYYNTIRNCGDAVTAYILAKVFEVTGRVVPVTEDHLLAIGSVFFMASKKSHIWGSGVMNPKMNIPGVDPSLISALRGKKTVAYLRSLGHDIPDLPLGDPGVLISEFMQPSAISKYRAAVVPHHSGFGSKRWQAARESSEICLVDMMDDTLLPIQMIAESDVVLSQSLHGLIFAAALGKPYLWISGHSDELWNWKFQDWFTTCENAQTEPVLLNVPLEGMIRRAELRPCIIDRAALKAAFPRQLIEEHDDPVPDFDFHRRASPAQVFLDGEFFGNTTDPVQDVREFTKKATRIKNSVFARMPEPTYTAIISNRSTHIPDRVALLQGQRYLDEHRDIQFIWYPADVPSQSHHRFVKAGVRLSSGALGDGSVLLRPCDHLPADAEYAIYSDWQQKEKGDIPKEF
ncbi:polysaccharide pyruvyl transferase family protein [Paracoccus sp. TOH]|uniref:polysaccharide pyruvyl transferase family protein n=1 Tax=Paracoccus sp. TOH TaxID=1263728 RepID=UPI0025B0CA35|nr:polysaccharide pyruvyl transferase family protein [Paracoccus sp. TOH]WJS86014.1 polysaccharide pyruvyl transferase family protein [Paracoccus sp. TOH]